MGQPILVQRRVQGDIATFSGDRSLTGQDGARYFAADGVPDTTKLSAAVATRFFDLDPEIDYVYVAYNHVMVRRAGGWHEGLLEAADEALERFFVFYDGQTDAPIGGVGAGVALAPPGAVTDLSDEAMDALRTEHYNSTISYIRKAGHDGGEFIFVPQRR